MCTRGPQNPFSGGAEPASIAGLVARATWTGLLVICLLAAGSATAGTLEKLLMPGPLASAHAKYEAECERCHATTSKKPQRQACLECHDKVEADIRAQRGFHGHAPRARDNECRECHSDHQGRDADIVGLVPALFDHGVTDFPLHGRHKGVACVACHESGKAYREAPHRCYACHKSEDVHHGEMGKDCQNCHKELGWRESRFDHDKTDFVLRGKHRDVACAVCHPGGRYKDTPTVCGTCHRGQDKHAGLFGKQCDSCHVEQGWKKTHFNHDRDTDYPLKGRHALADCHSCHTERYRGKRLPTRCQACHRQADIHQGRFGKQCADCHNPKGWGRQAFDHAEDTGFALEGSHAAVPCNACHGQKRDKAQPRRLCVDCHRVDDVHKGSQGDRCNQCHGTDQWAKKVRFDHDLTHFPLVGMHAVTACAECHLDRRYAGVAQECNACHENDDIHQSRLGQKCAVCHNPNSWRRWVFDHATQTDYPLEGKHRQVACEECHRKPVRENRMVTVSTRCVACHLADDAHGGGFGSACERCHRPSGFLDLDLMR
jgi:hypothetical protein